MASRLLAVAIVAVFLFVGAGAISAAYTDSVRGSGEQTLITNETWSPSEGTTTTLDASNREDTVFSPEDNVTVYQNDTRIQQQGNWSWNDGNGTITTQSGTTMNTSETALVTYSYFGASDTQALLVDVGTLPIDIGGALMLLTTFALFVGVVAIFGRVL